MAIVSPAPNERPRGARRRGSAGATLDADAAETASGTAGTTDKGSRSTAGSSQQGGNR